MKAPSKRGLGMTLGCVYVAFGVVEVLTHRDGSAGALLFWGGSLLGGGALVVAGTLLLEERRALALTLLTAGALVATNATFWTVLLPLFAVYVVMRAYRDDDAGLIVIESPVEPETPD